MEALLTTLILTLGPVPEGWRELPRDVCYRAYNVNLDGVIATMGGDGKRRLITPRCIVKVGAE